MNIGGYELKVPSINVMGAFQNFLLWSIVCIAIIGALIWIFIAIKNKKTYKYPVTLRVRRSNGIKSRYDLMGGLVQGRNGIRDFKVKIPGVFRKKALGYVPDFSKAGVDDRLSFLQEGDATSWQQTAEELVMDKVIEITPEEAEKYPGEVFEFKGEDGLKKYAKVHKLLIEPIPTDTKTTTYNNLQQTKDLLDIKRLTAFGITIIGFLIMVVAHLISMYVQTKIKCAG